MVGWKRRFGSSKDRWYSNVPLSSADLPFKTLFNLDGSPNDLLISYDLGTEAVAEIHNKGMLLTDEPDSFFEEKTYSRHFSLSSAWHLIRKRHPCSFIAKHCWYKHLPLKVSIFMWKLMDNSIPTDKAIQRKGICIPFKCHCCIIASSMEYNNHLFLTSEVAKLG